MSTSAFEWWCNASKQLGFSNLRLIVDRMNTLVVGTCGRSDHTGVIVNHFQEFQDHQRYRLNVFHFPLRVNQLAFEGFYFVLDVRFMNVKEIDLSLEVLYFMYRYTCSPKRALHTSPVFIQRTLRPYMGNWTTRETARRGVRVLQRALIRQMTWQQRTVVRTILQRQGGSVEQGERIGDEGNGTDAQVLNGLVCNGREAEQ